MTGQISFPREERGASHFFFLTARHDIMYVTSPLVVVFFGGGCCPLCDTGKRVTLTSYSAAYNQPANQSQSGQRSGAHPPIACLLQSQSWRWTLATLTSGVFLQLAGDAPITSHYLKQPSEKRRGEEGGGGGEFGGRCWSTKGRFFPQSGLWEKREIDRISLCYYYYYYLAFFNAKGSESVKCKQTVFFRYNHCKKPVFLLYNRDSKTL